jgi:hypothetical protein
LIKKDARGQRTRRFVPTEIEFYRASGSAAYRPGKCRRDIAAADKIERVSGICWTWPWRAVPDRRSRTGGIGKGQCCDGIRKGDLRYKTLTFGVSALYTGVAGALSAIVVQFVAPDSFSFFLSVSFLVGLVIGGVGSIAGCLVGGFFVLYVPNIAESVSTGLAGVVYGVILLLVIFVMPDRAAGFARLTRAHVARAT